MLYDAANCLRTDPTDMQADGDVAEASAGVFADDDAVDIDEDTWAAIGRVTRRLLGALGGTKPWRTRSAPKRGCWPSSCSPT